MNFYVPRPKVKRFLRWEKRSFGFPAGKAKWVGDRVPGCRTGEAGFLEGRRRKWWEVGILTEIQWEWN